MKEMRERGRIMRKKIIVDRNESCREGCMKDKKKRRELNNYGLILRIK